MAVAASSLADVRCVVAVLTADVNAAVASLI